MAEEHASEQGRTEEPSEPVARASVSPLVDVYESEEELLLVADLPGIRRENLQIDVDDEHIVIEGRPADGVRGGEATVLAREFHAYEYRRRFTLPEGIDAERITAQLASGLLVMHLPKVARERPRKVEIKAP